MRVPCKPVWLPTRGLDLAMLVKGVRGGAFPEHPCPPRAEPEHEPEPEPDMTGKGEEKFVLRE